MVEWKHRRVVKWREGGVLVITRNKYCVPRAACCVLRAACCVLRAACCVLRAACCVLHAALLHDVTCDRNDCIAPIAYTTTELLCVGTVSQSVNILVVPAAARGLTLYVRSDLGTASVQGRAITGQRAQPVTKLTLDLMSSGPSTVLFLPLPAA